MQAENTDMTKTLIKHKIFCVTFGCFVGTEFLKTIKTTKNLKMCSFSPKNKMIILIKKSIEIEAKLTKKGSGVFALHSFLMLTKSNHF